MASLSAHLRQAGDHGRLGFHADCPVCREERLIGALSSEAVVTRRARTAFLTGVVAASLTTPPAVWGQEVDTRQEGTAAPQQPLEGDDIGGQGGAESPDFDPGGDTRLPFEAEAPQGTAPGTYDEEGESGALELEPELDHDVPPVELEDGTPPGGDDDAEAPSVPGAPAPQSPVTEQAPPATEAPEKPGAGPRNPDRGPIAKPRSPREGPDAKRDTPVAAPQVPQPAPPAASPAPPPTTYAPSPTPPIQTAQAAPETSARPQAAPAARSDAHPRANSRIHVVQPGESLWLIAKRTLPPDASVARIAREVNRLWELNEDRIATGDPDLLRIGTKLMLR